MGRAHEVRKAAMAKTALAKSKLYARYGKQIYVIAKPNSNIETNINLKRIIEKARKEQVPNEVIQRAIEKAKGGIDENYSPTRYEFLGPGGSMFIVECLTDNPARTIANVRNCFTKTGGKSGAVIHLFEQKAIFSLKAEEEKVFEVLVENNVDVDDIENEDGFITVYGKPNLYNEIRQTLQKNFSDIELEIDEISWLPLSYQNLDEQDEKSFEKLMDLLDENEDVQNIYHNVSKQD